jgi:hypothetical protein
MSPISSPDREPRKDRSAASAPTDAKVVPLIPKARESAGSGSACPPTDMEVPDPGPSAA